MHLVRAGGATVPSNALGTSGSARVLYFRNETGAQIEDEFIRVSNPLCAAACLATEQYRIRLFDTTYGVPRFNNGATQVTILIVQNTSDRGRVLQRALLRRQRDDQGTYSQNIPAFGAAVLNTSTVPGVAGKSGSIIVNNDGRYGVLTGKAVSAGAGHGLHVRHADGRLARSRSAEGPKLVSRNGLRSEDTHREGSARSGRCPPARDRDGQVRAGAVACSVDPESGAPPRQKRPAWPASPVRSPRCTCTAT